MCVWCVGRKGFKRFLEAMWCSAPCSVAPARSCSPSPFVKAVRGHTWCAADASGGRGVARRPALSATCMSPDAH
eukprot:6826880-Alexandrium_andersonii.AAC.1